jgi:translation initiation factor 3 subunit C
MSRFFHAGSDSDSDTDSSEYSSDEGQMFQSKNKLAAGSDSESDGSESESDDGSDDEAPVARGKGAALSKFGKGAADSSSESDDSSDSDSPKVLRSAKEKRFDEMRSIVKLLNNRKKINDWVGIQTGMFFRCYKRSVGSIIFLYDGAK